MINKDMKKIALLAFLQLIIMAGHSQNLDWVAFDTNGPMGECLFPQDTGGDVFFSEVIDCNMSKDSIFAYVKEWIYDVKKEMNLEINDRLDGISKIEFECEMPIGKEFVKINGPFGSDVGTYERNKSKVTFRCKIEIKDNKYRYTLNNFYTNRRRIPGEGKGEGPSNKLHWQRINSLTKEFTKKNEQGEKQAYIDVENALYHAEYDSVIMFVNGLKTMTLNKELDF